jgi:AraC family transcriptional regulator
LTSRKGLPILGGQVPRNADPVSFGSPRFVSVEAGPCLVTNAWFPPCAWLPPHHHARPIAAITLAGSGRSVLGSREVVMDPVGLHTEPAGDTHSNSFGTAGAHVIVIQPDPAFEELLRPCRAVLTEAQSLRLQDAGAIARRLQAEMDAPDTVSPLAIESACLELLVGAVRAVQGRRPADGGAPRWLSRVVEYMHARFLESPTLGEVSRVAGVHPAHLAREFRRAYKQSPASYVRRLRLEWAAERLERGHESVADVSVASGFADQSHFTRAFRRHAGVTPAAYRRDHAKARRSLHGAL